MALTAAESARLLAIEEMLNQLQTAVNNLATKQQVRQLLLIKQAEIDALTTRVNQLEELIQLIQQSL